MGSVKQKRTAEQLRLILSELIRLEMGDPRVDGITITEVTVDRELQHADIKVNALGNEEREDEVITALQSAQSYLRRELGQRVRLRKVPQLHFHWDRSLQQALEIDAILADLEIPPEANDDGDEEK